MPRFLYEALGEALAATGATAAFGLMAEESASLVGHLADNTGTTYYGVRHEAAAVAMADGYAWATGRLGIALLSRGPGFTNAITAAVTAVKGRRPLLMITGDNATELHVKPDNKQADHGAIAAAAGIRFFRAEEPEEALDRLWAAEASARAGYPAVLAIPVNFFNAPYRASGSQPTPPLDVKATPPSPASPQLERVVDLLARCERPLVLAGAGAMDSTTRNSLTMLAERVGALLGTSILANGLFSGHRLDLGVVGGFATDAGAEILREIDCVLAFGVSLNKWTMAHGAIFRDAPIVHVDIDPRAIGAYVSADVAIVGDAGVVAQQLLDALPREAPRSHVLHQAEVLARLSGPRYLGDDSSRDGEVDPRVLAVAFDEMLPAERVVVTDGGHLQGFAAMYVGVAGPGRFRLTVDFSSIGLGLGTALGVAVGRTDSTTVLFTGDGGLLMSLGELETAARYAVPLVVVVFNDHAYGAERHYLDLEGVPHHHAAFPDTDFAAIGRALGIRSTTLRSVDELSACRELFLRPTAPCLLDCKVNPEVRGRWFDDLAAARARERRPAA